MTITGRAEGFSAARERAGGGAHPGGAAVPVRAGATPPPLLLRVQPVEQPGEFADLAAVPGGEAAGVAGAAGGADVGEACAALVGEAYQDRAAVRRVRCAGDESELLQGVQLAAHRGLADAEVAA